MSCNVTFQPHPFRSGRIKRTTDSKPITDIIKELDTGFPLSQARVCRNGEIIKDFSLIARDGDSLIIKFVPYGSSPQSTGGAMKSGGLFLAGFGAILMLSGVGFVIGAALVGTGLSMALGGAVLMNIDIPSFNDREKPKQDPSIRGGRNQLRKHGRIPVLFGRHRVYPDLAANQHTQIIGNQQYFIQLFCGGYKDCTIDLNSIKLGETLITEFSATENIQQILSGADSVIDMEILQNGQTSRIYPHCVHEESLNTPVAHEIDGVDDTKIPGEIIRTTPANTDKINIDIFFHNGLGKYNDKGGIDTASVEIRALYKSADSDEPYELLGFFNGDSNIITGAQLITKRYQVTKEGLKPGQYSVKIERVTEDSQDSKIIDQVYAGSIRSYKTIDDNGNPIRPIRAQRQKDLTIIALKVMATSQLNGVIDSFNYIAASKLPVYSGNDSGPSYWLNTAETKNPAAMLMYALQGRAAQQQVDPSDIDWPAIEAFYIWCEEHGYSCNAYLSESVTIAELLKMIGNTARADILRIDSLISVVQDIQRPSHTQLYTPKNTISYSVTMFKADIPDAISLRYIDEDSGFAQQELSVYNTPDGNSKKEPDTIQKVDLWGVTNSIQARRIGMYNYACLKNRPFVHSIEVDFEYLVNNKGDWVQYAGDIALTGSVQGRIKGILWADGVCIGIDTDEPVLMTDDKQYAVRIRKIDKYGKCEIIIKDVVFDPGIRREKAVTYYPGEGEELYDPFIGDFYAVGEDNVYYEPRNMILFTEPLEEKDAPKAGNIYAFGVRGYEALDLIITDIQPGQNLSAVLTCVEYSPEIFDVDKPDFILPDFVNRITPVSGAVDSGVINPDRWRHFSVFHDSEEEPQRPAGNGQDGGWYGNQTFRSLWQSTKISESVESGEWALPVRIKAQRGTDDITPIWLDLTPQDITLSTDIDGNILAGILPITAQARLQRWNSFLTGAAFSLVRAPAGVSIDADGLITVSPGAALGDENKITVNAAYQSGNYTSTLTITKNLKNYSPRYLGATKTPGTSTGTVIINGVMIQAREGDWVIFTGISIWTQNFIYKWTNGEWKPVPPPTETERQNAAMYLVATADVTEGAPMGVFSNMQALSLIAKTIFTKLLAAGEVELNDEYGNGGIIRSANYRTSGGKLGWMIDFLGNALFNTGIFRGHVTAESLEAGPLSVRPTTTQTVNGNFSYNETAENIYNLLRAEGIWDITGNYNGIINKIEIVKTVNFYMEGSNPLEMVLVTIVTLDIYIHKGSTRTIIAKTTSVDRQGSTTTTHNQRTAYPLAFIFQYQATSMKLFNLPVYPTNPMPTESGTVFKQDRGDGSSYLLIKN